jgi:hypothetical protein
MRFAEAEAMMCPYYQDWCMCSAGKRTVRVPFKEVEYNVCRTDDYARCEAYRIATGKKHALPARPRGDSAAIAG